MDCILTKLVDIEIKYIGEKYCMNHFWKDKKKSLEK